MTNGTSYTFQVSAQAASHPPSNTGYSVVTPQSTATPTLTTPGTPVGLTATSATNGIKLVWVDTLPTMSGNGWYIYRSDYGFATAYKYLVSSVTRDAGSNTYSWTDNTVASSTFYSYSVAAKYTDPVTHAAFTSGQSLQTASVQQTPSLAAFGNAAYTPSVTVGNQYATVSWSTTSLPAGTSFNVYRTESLPLMAGPELIATGLVGNSYDDLYPRNGANYTYTVEAQYGAGKQSSQPSASVTPAADVNNPGYRPANIQSKFKTTINYDVDSGAVAGNIKYKRMISGAKLYIEFQRFGAVYIETGIQRDDPDLIRKGLEIIHYGLDQQSATDGSFTYSEDKFHSSSLFVEAAARAIYELATHTSPSYTVESIYPVNGGADTLSSYYIPRIYKAAVWLQGQYHNHTTTLPDHQFTHRFHLLAAGLQQAALLENINPAGANHDGPTSDLVNDAWAAANAGIAKKEPSGSRAAIMSQPDATHFPPPAALYPLGGTQPPGTKHWILALGVNPEKNDGTYDYFDVSYQGVGLNYASRYYNLITDSTERSMLRTMMNDALDWELTRVDDPTSPNPDNMMIDINGLTINPAGGLIDISGSSRMGIETNQTGTDYKRPDVDQLGNALTNVAGDDKAINSADTHIDTYNVWAYRIANRKENFHYDQVTSGFDYKTAPEVPFNGNDPNDSINYSIAAQTIGADYIEEGIQFQRNDLIDLGLRTLNSGFTQEISGRWSTQKSGYWSSVQFVEAASHAMLDLLNYKPANQYPASVPQGQVDWNTYYKKYLLATAGYGNSHNYYTAIQSAAAALYADSLLAGNDPTNSSNNDCARCYGLAAALVQAWQVNSGDPDSSTNLRQRAQQCVLKALSLQWANGINPKKGMIDVPSGTDETTNQADGILYAEHYYPYEKCTDVQQNLQTMIMSGLNWEAGLLTPQGGIVNQLLDFKADDLPDSFQGADDLFTVPTFHIVAERVSDSGKS